MVIIIRRRRMMIEVVLVTENETKGRSRCAFQPPLPLQPVWVPAELSRPIVKQRLYSKFPPRTPWHHTAMLCHLLPVAAVEILYIYVFIHKYKMTRCTTR